MNRRELLTGAVATIAAPAPAPSVFSCHYSVNRGDDWPVAKRRTITVDRFSGGPEDRADFAAAILSHYPEIDRVVWGC